VVGSPIFGITVFTLLVALAFSAVSPPFRSVGNGRDILTGYSHIGVLAVGMTLPLLVRGIDLSVGSIAGLTAMVVLDLSMLAHAPGWVCILAGLGTGLAAGSVNAFLIVVLRIQPFIATLATMVAFRGLIYEISGRRLDSNLTVIAIDDPTILRIDGRVWGIPLALVYLVVAAGIASVILRKTKLGINLKAVGSNARAARLAGVRVGRVTASAYLASGLCASIAGLVLVSRLTTATEDLGTGAELSAIAAAVIGGVSLMGGMGDAAAAAVAAILVGTIYIGLTLLGVTTYAQPVVVGVVLIGAVASDRLRTSRIRRADARVVAG